MTFKPSNGVPNPFKGGGEPSPTDLHDGVAPLSGPLGADPADTFPEWQPPLFAMTRPTSRHWNDLHKLSVHGHHFGRKHWQKMYVPSKGMTKGELAIRFKQAKKTLNAVAFVLSTWSTTNSMQGGIKGMAMGFISYALSNCRHFSPSELRSSMIGMISNLPEPYAGALSSVLSGSSPADKASRFIAAIRRIQRWQPSDANAEYRLKMALKQFSTDQIRSFLTSHPLLLSTQVMRVAEELATDQTNTPDIRRNAYKLLFSFGYPVDKDILDALDQTKPKHKKHKSSDSTRRDFLKQLRVN